MTNANPFAQRSTLEYELPPFAQIKEEHYLPAFYEGCAEHLVEVQAILDTPGAATFENTIVALEKSGQYLGRMMRVFYNKSSSDTNDALDAIEQEIAPKSAAHQDAISLNPVLFKRIKDLYDARESLGLNSEDAWLLERYFKDLIHKGAHLTEAQRVRLKELNEELSSLQTQFSKNVLADTNDLAVLVDSAEELDGLSENQIAAAAAAAAATLVVDPDAPPEGDNPGGYNDFWFESAGIGDLVRTSHIVYPKDGRVPEAVEGAPRQYGGLGPDIPGSRPVRYVVGGIAKDGHEDRGLSERCIVGFNSGPPFVPSLYNNNVQIFQNKDTAVIMTEMIHDARIVPLTKDAPIDDDIRLWSGDSRGWF